MLVSLIAMIPPPAKDDRALRIFLKRDKDSDSIERKELSECKAWFNDMGWLINILRKRDSGERSEERRVGQEG